MPPHRQFCPVEDAYILAKRAERLSQMSYRTLPPQYCRLFGICDHHTLRKCHKLLANANAKEISPIWIERLVHATNIVIDNGGVQELILAMENNPRIAI